MKKDVGNAVKVIERSQVVLLLNNGERYNANLLQLLKLLGKKYKSILYVTLNRPASKLLREFEKHSVNKERFFFIDVISQDIKFSEPIENCEYVTSKEPTELSIKIGEMLNKKKPQVLVFDSFHTMQAYESREVIVRFSRDLIAKLDVTNCRGVFPSVAADRDSPLTKDMEMFVDEVAEIE